MSLLALLNIAIFLVFIGILYQMQKKYVKFTKRVFAALGIGIAFGGALQFFFSEKAVGDVMSQKIIGETILWVNVFGNGYVSLLKMIVIPLIIVSIISAVINLKDGKDLGRMGGLVIGILVITTAISAAIGIGYALLFGLTSEGLASGAGEAARALKLEGLAEQGKHITETIVSVIPSNPFYAMTGQGDNATLSVVIFSGIIGVSALGIKKKKPESFESFKSIINALHDVVMRMVTLILRLTPFGVMALMTKVVATSDIANIRRLLTFVIASYCALLTVLLLHAVILMIHGLNPITFFKKSWPVLTFAFSSRSSAGTIPLNVETQVDKLGSSEGAANLSASLGATIGQNGCAGIYPAMLAIMIAVGTGKTIDLTFIITIIVVTAIGSFGVAGVGGGATFAALIVLSALNLPVALAGLLISIEPLIDMGRTAVNVSGAMTTGVVTSKLLGELDTSTYDANIEVTSGGEAL